MAITVFVGAPHMRSPFHLAATPFYDLVLVVCYLLVVVHRLCA